jgi:hypothetical protein
MELVQYEKAYAINDDTEKGWVVTGQVFKETDGQMSVNLSASNDGTHIGGFSYTIAKENRINTNMNVLREYEKEFSEYSHNTLDNILKELGIVIA